MFIPIWVFVLMMFVLPCIGFLFAALLVAGRDDYFKTAPVLHARWSRSANGVNDPECTACGWAICDDTDAGLRMRNAYCGHCGAKMDGEVPREP